MKKTTFYILITAIIILIFGLSLLLYQQTITGESVKEYDYSFTKAICDKDSCQDYEIVCENGSVLSTSPITEKISHTENWEDPRTEEEINKMCDN